MENDAFPSNSKSNRPAREVERKVEKVVTGEVIQRKPTLGRRLKNTFIAGEAGGVGQYIFFEVLVPAVKDVVTDVAQQFIERMLYGERVSGRRPANRSGQAHVSYHNRYSSTPPWNRDRRDDPRPSVSRRARATHNFDEIIIGTRDEAEDVIDKLFDLIKEYNHATVNDLYDLTGITGNFTDEKYGWTDLRGAGAVRVSGGYLLDLPKPELLD